MTAPRPPAAAAAAVGLAAVLLSGCTAAGPQNATTSPASASAPATMRTDSPTIAAGPDRVAGPAWAHVHTLVYDGVTLLLGTHEGLFQHDPGHAPKQLSDTGFDVMGLTHDGSRWLASGHPGKGERLPSDLGLRASPDGRAWTTVSLLGKVDFHRLTAAGASVLGVSAHDGALLRSIDRGISWTRLDNPDVFDLALDPGDPSSALATTQSGPIASTDGGSTWTPVRGAPLLAFLAWTSTGVYGIAPEGAVHVSSDDGATWQRRGSAGGQPSALAADRERLAALVGGSVVESLDGGLSFRPRLTGIGGH